MAEATELGVGYISLAISTKGLGSQVAREFTGVERQADKSGKRAGKLLSGGIGAGLKAGAAGVAAIGAVGALAGIKETIGAAGELEQSVGGVQAVFKDYAKNISASSKQAATAVGLSENAYNQLAATIGSTLKNKGVKDFGKQTENLIGLGADLASQFGGSTQEAVDALSSALRGESDPIERYGVSLNQAAIQAEAVASGIAKGKEPLTDQQKAMAALALINRQTADAQGNFARETDTLAGKQAAAAAQFENLKATIGNAFLPAASAAMGFISKTMLPAFQTLATTVGPRVTAAFTTVKNAFSGLTSSGAPATSFLQTKLVPALNGIITAGRGLASVVLPIIRQVVTAFLEQWPKIQPVVVGIFRTIGGIVTDVMALIKGQISTVTKVVAFIWSRWGTQITKIAGTTFKTVIGILSGAFKIIGGLVKIVTGLMTGNFSKAGSGVKLVMAGMAKILKSIFAGVRSNIATVTEGIRAKISEKFNAVRDKITSTIRFARDTVRTILGAGAGGLQGIFSSAVGAIGRIWDGLKAKTKAPIKFVIDTVINGGLIKAFNAVAGLLPGVKAIPQISVPGFHDGGYTGRIDPRKPAGVVHGDEHVIRSKSRQRIEKMAPGYLDYLNEHGRIPGYAKGGRVNYKGGTFSSLFASRLQQAEKLSGATFNIFQGGFRPRTSYSGTSHQGDAVDLGPIRSSVVKALRQVGIAAWDRTGKGNWAPHIHGVPLPGAGYGAGSAVYQAQDYLRGGDGLGGRDNGPRVNVASGLGDGSFLGSLIDPLAKFKDAIAKPLNRLRDIGDSPFSQMAKGVVTKLKDAMLGKVKDLAGDVVGNVGSKIADVATGGSNRARGLALMLRAGFGPSQFSPLNKLWTKESGWRTNAKNPSSGAYGIPQSLPGSKMASVGNDWRTNPNTQIRWGLGYIKDRYKTPAAAWAHSQRLNWYDQGGVLEHGTLGINTSRKPEAVLTNVQWKMLDRVANRAVATQGSGLASGVHIGQVNGMNPEDVAREVVKHIRRQERLNPTRA